MALLPRLVQALEPDVLCLQELAIRRGDDVALTALQSSLPSYHCYYSLARDPRIPRNLCIKLHPSDRIDA